MPHSTCTFHPDRPLRRSKDSEWLPRPLPTGAIHRKYLTSVLLYHPKVLNWRKMCFSHQITKGMFRVELSYLGRPGYHCRKTLLLFPAPGTLDGQPDSPYLCIWARDGTTSNSCLPALNWSGVGIRRRTASTGCLSSMLNVHDFIPSSWQHG